jgi:membrane protease YdiL (CAAX protease family)
MMQTLSIAVDVLLAGYVGWEVVSFVPRFRKLKQQIANGDTHARTKVYQRAIIFECATALLALFALGFDWSKSTPANLGLETVTRSLSGSNDFNYGSLMGVIFGMSVGTIVFVIFRLRANRRGAVPSQNLIAPWLRNLLPDFSALVPVTNSERLIWIVVAISAGICEEIVFRGWLLTTLHDQIGLTGKSLLLVGALIFGLAHAYQKAPGVILTALVGGFFCVLYVKTGSLLIPILLHALVDLRFAFLPAPKMPQLTPVES